MYGSKTRKANTTIVRELVTRMKQEVGIALTLDERRALEISDVARIMEPFKVELLQMIEYLEHFKDMQMENYFTKVNGIFCDGIILPRLA